MRVGILFTRRTPRRRWRNDFEKKEFGFHGVYRQVTAPQKIVNTETFDPGTFGGDMGAEGLVTVTFLDSGKSTMVTTQLECQSKEDLDKELATGMTDGMGMSFKLLDKVLV